MQLFIAKLKSVRHPVLNQQKRACTLSKAAAALGGNLGIRELPGRFGVEPSAAGPSFAMSVLISVQPFILHYGCSYYASRIPAAFGSGDEQFGGGLLG